MVIELFSLAEGMFVGCQSRCNTQRLKETLTKKKTLRKIWITFHVKFEYKSQKVKHCIKNNQNVGTKNTIHFYHFKVK